MTSSYKSDWRHGKTSHARNMYMFEHQIGTDIKFVVEEGNKEIKAHKFILISRSPVLAEMFSSPESSAILQIDLPNVHGDILKVFLRYLYSDETVFTSSNVQPVLVLAKMYNVESLIKECSKWIKRTISIGTVLKILEHAYEVKEHDLLETCLHFIFKHARQILQSPKFESISPECLELLLKPDDLAVDESVVYEAAMRWAEKQCRIQNIDVTDTNKREVLGKRLHLIRFPIMDQRFFATKVSSSQILNEKEKIEIFRYQNGNTANRTKVKDFVTRGRSFAYM
ncbi:hypothetical protein ACJMK2_017867 [Sinanodonta woodiana]|uniref:BTB domain-containing protein n=1 Tax=Sinanodonta woodiana TaxID=1069815 RepID=A0ABD3UDA5_SINWO